MPDNTPARRFGFTLATEGSDASALARRLDELHEPSRAIQERLSDVACNIAGQLLARVAGDVVEGVAAGLRSLGWTVTPPARAGAPSER